MMNNNNSEEDNTYISECKEKNIESVSDDCTSSSNIDVSYFSLSNDYIKNSDTNCINISSENINSSNSNNSINSTHINNSNNNKCYKNCNTNTSSCELKSVFSSNPHPNTECNNFTPSNLSQPSKTSSESVSPPPPFSLTCSTVPSNSFNSCNSLLPTSSISTSSSSSSSSNSELRRQDGCILGCLNSNTSSTLSSFSFSSSSSTSSLSLNNVSYGFPNLSIPPIRIKDPYMDLFTPGIDIKRKTEALREVISMGVQSLNGKFLTKVWNRMKESEEVKIISDLIKEDKDMGKYDGMLKEIGRLRFAIDIFNSNNNKNNNNNNNNNNNYNNYIFNNFSDNKKRKKKIKKARKNESEKDTENKRKREIESDSDRKIEKEEKDEESINMVCRFNFLLNIYIFYFLIINANNCIKYILECNKEVKLVLIF